MSSKNVVVAQEAPKSEIVVAVEKIKSGLEVFEARKAEFIALVGEGSGIIVSSLEEKDMIKKAEEVRKKIKKARAGVEGEAKGLRDPLTAINKGISSKEKELVDILAPEEKRLEDIGKWVKSEEDRLEREEKEKEEKRIQDRINKLAEYGYGIDLAFLTSVSDEDFEKIVANAKSEYEKEQVRLLEEKDLEEKNRVQREKEQKELEDLRKEKRASRIAILSGLGLRQLPGGTLQGHGISLEKTICESWLAYPTDEWNAEISRLNGRIEEDKKEQARKEEEKKVKDAAFEVRKAQLLKMGFVHEAVDGFFLKGTWACDWEDVYNPTDEEWDVYVKGIEKAIELKAKKDAEDKGRMEKEQREGALRSERTGMLKTTGLTGSAGVDLGTMSTDDWNKYWAEKKKAYDDDQEEKKRLQKEKEEQEEAERIAAGSDKEKVNRIIEQFQSIAYPEMKSAKAKKLVGEVKALTEKIIAHIKSKG